MTKRKKSEHALCSESIRKDLKKNFPSIKFSVTSKTYSGGNSIDIDWMDGPTTEMIEQVISKYKNGTFDGMTDSYSIRPNIDKLPRVNYIHTNRHIAEDTYVYFFGYFKRLLMGWEHIIDMDETSDELHMKFGNWTARQYIRRKLNDIDLTDGLPEKFSL